MAEPVVLDTVGASAQQAASTVAHKAVLVPRRGDRSRAALLEDVILAELALRRASARAEEEAAAAAAAGGASAAEAAPGGATRPPPPRAAAATGA